ncbi:CAMK/CAMK1 protein kinase [Ceratobasidium sp. AG-Ba]|nr:CAMK/CAMK1 protein kinase [Ceratobasidium sp. AG-Ba]
MSTIDSGVYLLESDIDQSLAERKHGRDKDPLAIDFPTPLHTMSQLGASPGEHQHERQSSPARTGGRVPLRTSHSAPPGLGILHMKGGLDVVVQQGAAKRSMDSSEDDEDRVIAIQPTRLERASSVGNNYGVTGIGRGFNLTWDDESEDGNSQHSDHHIIQDESDQPTPPAKEPNLLPVPGDAAANLVVIPPTPEPPRYRRGRPRCLSANPLKRHSASASMVQQMEPRLPRIPIPHFLSAHSPTLVLLPRAICHHSTPRVRSPNLSPSSSSQHLLVS